jgi:hypothetical protein
VAREGAAEPATSDAWGAETDQIHRSFSGGRSAPGSAPWPAMSTTHDSIKSPLISLKKSLEPANQPVPAHMVTQDINF